MAQPRTVDPASLGSRMIAGYFAAYDVEREVGEHGLRYTESFRPGVFNDEVTQFGADHAWSVLFDHGVTTGTDDDDPDRLAIVPIGRTVEIDPHDPYGPFVVCELREGRLADEVLAAARAGELGFSHHSVDLDPHQEKRGGRLYVTRRRMALREVSLTARPYEPRAIVVAVGSALNTGPGNQSGLELRDVSDEDLIRQARAMIENTGGSLPLLQMRVAQERAAERRRIKEQATLIRELAHCVVEGHRRAAALWAAAAVEAGRYPQDPLRPAAVITAEAVIEAAGARQAEAELREACVNDQALIGAVMREVQTA